MSSQLTLEICRRGDAKVGYLRKKNQLNHVPYPPVAARTDPQTGWARKAAIHVASRSRKRTSIRSSLYQVRYLLGIEKRPLAHNNICR